MASSKVRLDTLLVERGLAESVAQAQAMVMAGEVYKDTEKLTKAGQQVSPDIPLEIKTKKQHPWVSRGGIKLAHGLKHFAIDPSGLIAADIGASTGGFTDVLLTNGAKKVYSVDVGYGELAWKLRNDERVVVLERTNARNVTKELLPEPLEMIVCDASFIGLQTVLPAALSLAKDGAYLIALIKPQFEVEKGQVGEKGVVSDPLLHKEVCDKIHQWLDSLLGWSVMGVAQSPIKGPEGNIEFLIAASKNR